MRVDIAEKRVGDMVEKEVRTSILGRWVSALVVGG